MTDHVRQRPYSRRASHHDELEESISRHERFRSSIFSSVSRPSPPKTSTSYSSVDPGSEKASVSGSESRIDNAIQRAMEIDANRDSNPFQYPFTPQSSIDSSGTTARNEIGTYKQYHRQAYAEDKMGSRSVVGGGGISKPRRGNLPEGIPEMNGDNGAMGRGDRATPPTRSTWVRGGGEDTARGVWGTGGRGMAPSDVSSGISEADGEAGESDFGRGMMTLQTRDQKSIGSTVDTVHVGVSTPAPEWTVSMDPNGGDAEMALEDGSLGHHEMTLTPREYEDPLSLPGGEHHISFAKFLEVMTGPGLRVRKHHRAGKGNSGLRVLRYDEESDSLMWDSHKILGAAQHVLPIADVEDLELQQEGNRVVLTCVGGRDSYAVFEAVNHDAAAVLFVGLERLWKRKQSSNYC